jgi:ribose-phosphate pyrophosphokinase
MTPDAKPPLLLTIPSYADLAARIAGAGRFEPAPVERRRFPDGESYQRLEVDPRGREVVLVAGTTTDQDTLLAYDLASAAVRYGAQRLTWVCPFFGHSTMERATRPGEVVTAKTRARLISAVPRAALGNDVLLVDLHAAGIPHYFGDGVNAFHLYAKPLHLIAARALGGPDLVLAAPDTGRAAWVASLAQDLGAPTAFVTKRRASGSETHVTSVTADVEGKTVVMYDDMVRTGSTLIEAARTFRSRGARSVHAVTTHLVLPGDALDRLRAPGALDGLAGTDTHPRAREVEGQGVQVRSVAPLIAAWLEGRSDESQQAR